VSHWFINVDQRHFWPVNRGARASKQQIKAQPRGHLNKIFYPPMPIM